MKEEKKCPKCDYGYLALVSIEKQYSGYTQQVQEWACDECLYTEPKE